MMHSDRNGNNFGYGKRASMSNRIVRFLLHIFLILLLVAAGTDAGYADDFSITQFVDKQAPSVPDGLVSNNISNSSFTLSWKASIDNGSVSTYEIFKNGTLIGTTSLVYFTVTGLSDSTAYTLTVQAKDASGNVSGLSSPLIITTTSSIPLAKDCVGWSTLYYLNWDTNPPSTIYWSAYTHVIHFALAVLADGSLTGASITQAQAFVTACHTNGVKALIGVGGDEANWVAAVEDSTKRALLVINIINFLTLNGYDGVDIDFEPLIDNNINKAVFKALFSDLHTAINQITPSPLLTAAVGSWLPKCVAAITPYCDQMNAMCYETPANGVNTYMSAFKFIGIPNNKLGIGIGYTFAPWNIDVDNPTDVADKCQLAINQGYGGVMAWDSKGAGTNIACQIANSQYVCHLNTGVKVNHMFQNVIVYPNPVSTYFNVSISNVIILKNAIISIYNESGLLVKKLSITNHQMTIDRVKQQSGIYFYILINNNMDIGKGKLVVQ